MPSESPPPPPPAAPPPPPSGVAGPLPPPPPPAPARGGPAGWTAQTPPGPQGFPEAPAGWTPSKPPPPAAPVAGWLMIGGAVAMVIGSVLTWFSIFGEDVTGFTEFAGESRDGPFFALLAVVLAAFGLTTLLAKRLLPIAILAVVLASFGLLAALVDYGDVQDATDLGAEAGPGLPVVIVGCLAALAGGIVALAKRRR